MKRTYSIVLATALTAILGSPSLEGGNRSERVRGKIIKVEQQVPLENAGSFDRLTIRTPQGEEIRLRLPSAGSCPDCYRKGDEIRARVDRRAGIDGDHPVERMRLRRDGRTFDFCRESNRTVRHHHERGGHRDHHRRLSRSQGGGYQGG